MVEPYLLASAGKEELEPLNLCTERSPKKSDEIRNQMLYRYN